MFTDHKALKSLLHTYYPSGKHVQLRMSLPELGVLILHCPGIGKQNVDALPITLIQIPIKRQ